MKHSTHYQFFLPETGDSADIGDLNANFAAVDAELAARKAATDALTAEKLARNEMTLHCAAQNPHAVTAAQTGAYAKAEADAAVAAYVEQRMSEAGNGDMLKSIYDKDGDGVVDIAKNAAVHSADKQNPHGVTKAQIGLGLADNTPDAQKNVLSAKNIDGGTY